VVTGSFPTGERAHKHGIEESKARDRQIPCSFEQIRAFCVLFGVFGAFGVLSGRFSEWLAGGNQEKLREMLSNFLWMPCGCLEKTLF